MATEARALKGASKGAQKTVKVDGMVVLRQAQVQEAVAFMAHPRVRDARTEIKRMLLLGGGLTGAEVDEAFDRLKAFGAALIPPRRLGFVTHQTAASDTVNALAASAQLHGGGSSLAALERHNTPASQNSGSLAKAFVSFGLVAAGIIALRDSALQCLAEWVRRDTPVANGSEQCKRNAKLSVQKLETICSEVNHTRVVEGSIRDLVEDMETFALRFNSILVNDEISEGEDEDLKKAKLSKLKTSTLSSGPYQGRDTKSSIEAENDTDCAHKLSE